MNNTVVIRLTELRARLYKSMCELEPSSSRSWDDGNTVVHAEDCTGMCKTLFTLGGCFFFSVFWF